MSERLEPMGNADYLHGGKEDEPSLSEQLARLDNVLAAKARATENQTAPEQESYDLLAKAEAAKHELIANGGIEDTFRRIDIKQPDGSTQAVIGSDDYPVMRSDGRIDYGWQTYILGKNLIMTKPETDQNGRLTGHEMHKMLPQADWLKMQHEVFSRRLESFYARMKENASQNQDSEAAPLAPGDDRRVVDFGRVEMELSKLLNSPNIAGALSKLSGAEKDGRSNKEVIRELEQIIKSGQYSEDKESMPIYVQFSKSKAGDELYSANGGLHRLAAAALAGADKIEVDLNTREGYLDGKTEAEFRTIQVHSQKADAARENIKSYNSETRVV